MLWLKFSSLSSRALLNIFEILSLKIETKSKSSVKTGVPCQGLVTCRLTSTGKGMKIYQQIRRLEIANTTA